MLSSLKGRPPLAFPEEAAASAVAAGQRRWQKPRRRRPRRGIGACVRGVFFGIAWLVVRVWRGVVRGGRPGDAQGQRPGDGALRTRRARLPDAAAGGAGASVAGARRRGASRSSLTLRLVPLLGTDLIPQLAQDRFEMTVKLPPGTPLRETDALVRELQAEHAKDEGIARAVRRQRHRHAAGCQPDRERREHRQAHRGDGRRRQRGRRSRDDRAPARRRCRRIPDAQVDFSRPELFSFSTPLEIELRGQDLEAHRSAPASKLADAAARQRRTTPTSSRRWSRASRRSRSASTRSAPPRSA